MKFYLWVFLSKMSSSSSPPPPPPPSPPPPRFMLCRAQSLCSEIGR